MSSGVTSDFMISLAFLRRFHPSRLWVLTAIVPDGDTRTVTFDSDEKRVDDKARKGETFLDWLEEHGTVRNLYFSVAESVDPLSSKIRREHVKAVHWFHVDVDARAGEDLAQERIRILALLREPPPGVPLPTVIVFSGGGYQAFWRLREPIAIDGDVARAEETKRYNLQLEMLLGGDNCHDVSRIMRLPGTVNRPDERKQKRGRVDVLAELVEWHDDRTYDSRDFTSAAEVQKAGRAPGLDVVKVNANVRRLRSVDDLPQAVSGKCKEVIVQGKDCDDPDRWPSRSEALFWVCLQLVRAGCDDDTIFSVITDRTFSISASVLGQRSNTTRYALRQIERAREEAVDPWLRRLNDDFAVIGNYGGRCRILTEVTDVIGGTRRSRVYFLPFNDFHNWGSNKFIEWHDNDGNAKSMPIGRWWTSHPMRREYKTLVFAPGIEVPGVYNLWKGFAYDATPGDCSLYLEHVKENICGGDDDIFRYLLNWMAVAVQRPARPGHTAVVMRGKQGTGKGIFANVFGALFGRHFLAVRDSVHLFGQFNAHLRDCVVLYADEAFWAGNKKHEGLLKSLITEETVVSEAKYVDAELVSNYIHLIMASNEDWVVPAGATDRRFLVLDVGDARIQNTTYFADLMKQMKKGGYEALLHMLMTRDLSNFNVRTVPQTDALREQKERSLSDKEEWWYSKLRDGRILETDLGWPRYVFSSQMCYDFTAHCKRWGFSPRSNNTSLGRFMGRMCVNRKRIGGQHTVLQLDGTERLIERPYAYVLPSLGECRAQWDACFGGPYPWPQAEEQAKLPGPEEPY